MNLPEDALFYEPLIKSYEILWLVNYFFSQNISANVVVNVGQFHKVHHRVLEVIKYTAEVGSSPIQR